MKYLKYLFFIIIFACIFSSVPVAQADVHTAASCSYADVSTAVTAANDGDTAQVPAGTCVWNSTLIIPAGKAVSIIGAGKDATIITNNVHIADANGGGDTSTLIKWSGTADKSFRLSGIRFNNSDHQTPVIALVGPIYRVRIDNVIFNKGDVAIGTNYYFSGYRGTGAVYGVVDHSSFYNMSRPYFAMDVRDGEGYWGAKAWTESIIPGSEKMMYFEDNQFIWDSNLTDGIAQGGLYGSYGGRAVFRHNTFSGLGTYIDAHGDGQGGSGQVADPGTIYYEIYNNTFVEDDSHGYQGNIMGQRGGQWIVHDNIFTGSAKPITMTVYYTSDAVAHRVMNTYFWGNSWNGNSDQSALAAVTDSGQTPAGYSATNIKLDQQYFLHAPQSGQTYYPYTPYTYPHPLQMPSCTSANWTSSDGACQPTNTLTRTWTQVGTCTGGVQHPATESQSCTYIPPTSGIVAQYTFDAGSGVSVVDSSGNANTGTISKATWIAGKVGTGALNFNGSAKVTTSSLMSLGTTNSMSAWVKFDSASPNAVIAGKNSYSDGGYLLYVTPTTLYYSANGVYVGVPYKPTANTWTHFAVVRDHTSVTFYVNNVKQGATQTLASDNAIQINTIGSLSTGGFGLVGSIDDLYIYNKAITQTDITTLYALGTSSNPCTSFTYSAWSTCTNNLQTRTYSNPLPIGCTGGTPITTQSCGTSSSYTFTTTLKLGTRSEDVRQLQIFLNTHGYPIATSGVGSLGNESAYFGISTYNAVKKFQKANGISATGTAGPVTLAKIRGLN